LLVVSGFWPSSSNSISGIFVTQQIGALARFGCRVTVVVGNTLGREFANRLPIEALGLPADIVRLVEVPLIRLPERLSGAPGALRCNVAMARVIFGAYISRLARDFGPFGGCIVHGLRYTGLSIPAWRRYVSGKVTMVVHGVDPFWARPRNADRARDLLSAAGEASDAVVLVGSPLLDHALRLGLPSDKLVVLPNGTDLPALEAISDAQRSRTEVRQIVSVSNLISLKGIDDNLRGLATVTRRRPDLMWSYEIVGDGPERRRLLALAMELGISDKVRFSGRLAYEETMRRIEAADIFSLPSWGEAFGIVYLEAMARMRPVIGCFENGAADIVTDGRDGRLVPPRDGFALAAALEQLIENPGLCATLGRQGRWTAERFGWASNARRILSLCGIAIEECA